MFLPTQKNTKKTANLTWPYLAPGIFQQVLCSNKCLIFNKCYRVWKKDYVHVLTFMYSCNPSTNASQTSGTTVEILCFEILKVKR
jgi:hypothetical protein